MINMFLHGCSDHRDQLFCLFELKKASLALRIESRFEKIFSLYFTELDFLWLFVYLRRKKNIFKYPLQET